jgi:hypothetical protein
MQPVSTAFLVGLTFPAGALLATPPRAGWGDAGARRLICGSHHDTQTVMLKQDDWANRFVHEMHRLGSSFSLQRLQELGAQLWKTYGLMLPEDVASFEHEVLGVD